MNITLTILIIESIVVLLGISGFLFFLPLKKKSKKLFELNQILENSSSHEGERKAHLANHLQEGYALSTEAAAESAGCMVEAEKQFIQQFIKEQIEQASVADFHQNLCELLDQYLYFVPTSSVEPSSTVDENNLTNDEQAEITTKATLIEEQSHDSAEKKEEKPDWGEAFEESGDKVDEQTQAVFDSNNDEKESDAKVTEEPDWGDAFAESGDEVDEQTKAGYEADSLKTE